MWLKLGSDWDWIDEVAESSRVAWLVITLLALVVLIATGAAQAAPQAGDSSECMGAADMAITARAMVEEGIAEKKIRAVVTRMYPAELIEKWADSVLAYAQSTKKPAAKAAGELYQHCAANRGNMDGLLGVAL
jgi:hypothetical protein